MSQALQTENSLRPDTVEDVATLFDRRRPGRMDVSPSLVGLLREPALGQPDDSDAGEAFHLHDPVAPLKGILLGVALSIPLWGLLIFVGYEIFS